MLFKGLKARKRAPGTAAASDDAAGGAEGRGEGKRAKRRADHEAESGEGGENAPGAKHVALSAGQEEGNEASTSRKAKRVKESAAMGTKEHRREQKRKWIERDGSDGMYCVLIQRTRKTAPRLKELEDARSVVRWFRETGYVGVRPDEPNDDDEPQTYSTFVIRDGKLEFLDDATFDSAEKAAREHDAIRKELHLRYVRNFKRSYSTPGSTGRFDLPFNDAARPQYRASIGRWGITRVNIRFMRFVCLRMLSSARSVEGTISPKRRSESWKALRTLMRIIRFWDVGHMVEGRDIRETFDSLFAAWKAGDALIVEEFGEMLFRCSSDDSATRRHVETRGIEDRCSWCDTIITQIDNMRETVLRYRRYPKRVLKNLNWAWQPLRLYADLLRRLNAPDLLRGFAEKRLHGLSNDVFWSRLPQFLILRGEFLVDTGEIARMLEAKSLFVRAMDADPSDSRAVLALAHVEHVIANVRQRTYNNVQLVSVSQRTTQDLDMDGDDDDEEAEEQDGLKTHVVEEDGPKRVLNAVRQNPENINNWLALEALLFAENDDDDGDGGDTPEAIERKRACLLRLIKVQPSLKSALPRLYMLWRLTKDAPREARLDFFWALADVIEGLTQRECPSFAEYFSSSSVPLWELAVVCLHTLPLQAAVFHSATRAKLWRRRFFPNIVWSIFQDPLAFTRTDRFSAGARRRRRRNASNEDSEARCEDEPFVASFRHDQYLFALKAVVASMTDVAPYFHEQVARAFGNEFVNKVCVLKAIRSVDEQG